MSVKYYPRITRRLLTIAHNKKRNLSTPKDDKYLEAFHKEADLEDYYKWLADDINYG